MKIKHILILLLTILIVGCNTPTGTVDHIVVSDTTTVAVMTSTKIFTGDVHVMGDLTVNGETTLSDSIDIQGDIYTTTRYGEDSLVTVINDTEIYSTVYTEYTLDEEDSIWMTSADSIWVSTATFMGGGTGINWYTHVYPEPEPQEPYYCIQVDPWRTQSDKYSVMLMYYDEWGHREVIELEIATEKRIKRTADKLMRQQEKVTLKREHQAEVVARFNKLYNCDK